MTPTEHGGRTGIPIAISDPQLQIERFVVRQIFRHINTMVRSLTEDLTDEQYLATMLGVTASAPAQM
jgi:hypothetical protein